MEGHKMKAAIYYRVSTEGQEQDGTSLQTQLEACLKYCQVRNYEVVKQFKEAYSGLSLERPQLDELRTLIRESIIDVVVVYSLDRLSRDPVHGVILMQEMEKHGVYLEAATETVDNSEVGKLIFYIKGYAAKLDAERRRDATGRGKQALLKAGKMPQGTGIGVYGYEWIKEYKKRIPIEREAKIVKRMFEMVARGDSCFKIARIFNQESIPTKSGKKWEARTVSRIVRNPAYIGITYFGKTAGKDRKVVPQNSWIILPDVTPAIIDTELFNMVQDVLAKSKELHPGRAMHEYPLVGLAKCAKCGSPLIGSFQKGKYRYYRCRGTTPTSSKDKICNAGYINADMLENVVWENVKSVLSNPEILLYEMGKQIESESDKASYAMIDSEIKELNRKLKKYPAQERRIMQAFKFGFTEDVVLDEMNQTKKEKEADKKKLDELIKTKESIMNLQISKDNMKELCAKIVPDLENCDNYTKKDAYTHLDLHIKATREGIDIKGHFEAIFSPTGQTLALQHEYNYPIPPGGRRRGWRGWLPPERPVNYHEEHSGYP
jgi:site-specific DNA recombinase